jgi:hypothetical protein
MGPGPDIEEMAGKKNQDKKRTGSAFCLDFTCGSLDRTQQSHSMILFAMTLSTSPSWGNLSEFVFEKMTWSSKDISKTPPEEGSTCNALKLFLYVLRR